MSICVEDLPLSILLLCLEHLDHHDIRRLSLTDKYFRDLTFEFKFRTVRLRVSTKLVQDCIGIKNKILAFSKLSCVRHFKLIPAHLTILEDNIDFQNVGIPAARPLKPWKYTAVTGKVDEISSDQWKCLISFIQELPALREITWACRQPMPSLFLQQAQHQRCRLHMRSFRLPSLVHPRGQPPDISKEDLELVTSSALHSLAYLKYDGGSSNYIDDAVMEMVSSRAAPNLKEVCRSRHQIGGNIFSTQAYSTPAKPWQPGLISSKLPLVQSKVPTNGRGGTLERLVLEGSGCKEELRRWHEITNFSLLTRLKVYEYMDASDLKWLRSCDFRSLKELAISGEAQNVSSFVLALPPLRHIELNSDINDRALAEIVNHCNRSLESFYCTAFAEPAFFQLLEICPQLEELGVNIHRKLGSAAEVANYHRLGALRQLRKIYLSIHSPHPVENLGQDSSLHELISTIKNLAFDSSLARSIFETISKAKLEFSAPLERLELRMDALSKVYGQSDLKTLLAYIGKSWICTRSPSMQNRFGCAVELYHKNSMNAYEQSNRPALEDLLSSQLAPAITAVWPESECDGLQDVWHSFPLLQA